MTRTNWVNLIPFPNRAGYPTGVHVVYLVYAASFDVHKIGWTADLRERLQLLPREQCAIAVPPYKLIHTINTCGGPYLERQLHLLFRHRHSSNEWFRLTKADVQWIKRLGSDLPEGIPATKDIVPPLAEWIDE